MEQTQPEHEWTQVEGAPEWRVRLHSDPGAVWFRLARLSLEFAVSLDWPTVTSFDLTSNEEDFSVPSEAIDAARDLLGIPHPQLVEFNGWGDNVKRYEEDADNERP